MPEGEMEPEEIIAAPATPRGKSALAVVRLSGEGCRQLVERLMRLEPRALARGRMRRVGLLYGAKGPVDRVVALHWRRGASYTGEEMVELSCHGEPGRVDALMEAIVQAGARTAERGEFTRRALLSGRMKPLDVIELAALYDGWKWDSSMAEELAKARSLAEEALELLEGLIEFEEEHGGQGEEMDLGCLGLCLRRAAETASHAEGARDVAVMGPPNSGKSSLVNRMAGREVALVDQRPGTTRDGASAEMEIAGVRLVVRDTAGAGGAGLDGVAYRRDSSRVDAGTLVIWMEANQVPEAPEELRRTAGCVLELSSLADLYEGGERRLSLVTGEGLDDLYRALEGWVSRGSLAAELSGVSSSCRRAEKWLAAGDWAMAAEELKEVERRLAAVMDGEGGSVLGAVQRSLGRLCVGK
jgi:tRNA modification GTPase